jgi:transcriptional regulator with XRE-family HTH domain
MDKKDLSPGGKIKKLRQSLQMTLRDVQERSEKMAADKSVPHYVLSKGWLNQIEHDRGVPSIFKLYTLSAIYSCSWEYLNSFFNLRISDLAADQVLYGVPRTRLLGNPGTDTETVELPLQFLKEERLSKTNLLTKLVAMWGDVPVPLLRLLSPQKTMYGLVGLDDYTLYPLIRPGSLVQIDTNQTKVLDGSWPSEHDRPVYFVELRGDFACGWCELKRGILSIVPHPQSGREIRRFEFERQADILGRVTGVAMRIAESAGRQSDRGGKK